MGPDIWEPLWTAAERMGLPLTFHIGTGSANVVYRGPGGAVVNMETTYPGMRVVSHTVAAGGALDRAPRPQACSSPRVVPRGCRRSVTAWTRPPPARNAQRPRPPGCPARSSVSRCRLPSSDISAIAGHRGHPLRQRAVGDDHPHLEGTYGHTQQTLHTIFDGVDDRIRDRVLRGASGGAFRGMSSTTQQLSPHLTACSGSATTVHLIASRSSRSEFLVFPAEPGQETVELEHLGHVVHLDQPGVRTARTGYHRR